jgi:alpha-1,2-mannosyltransferase
MLATAVSIAAAWKALTGEWSVRTLGRSLLAGAVAVVTIPVISICISQGQTASIIMAALILDALVIRHRGQGVLTGAAAAIKLYPALFIFWWLVKREWRPARNAAASALATTALAWWVWPGYSHRFFFYRLISGREVSHFHDKIHWRATSSSPYTVFFRPPFGQSTLSSVLGSIAIVVVTVGLVYAAWRIFRRGYPISAFVVGLMAATFAAPVVWDHYFAWAVLFIPVAIELGWKSRAGLAALLALVTTMIPWGLARDENFSNVGLTPTTMLIFVARNALLVTSVIFAVVATTAPLRGDNASAGELVE